MSIRSTVPRSLVRPGAAEPRRPSSRAALNSHAIRCAAGTAATEETYGILVGQRAHRIAGLVLEEGLQAGRLERAAQILTAARGVMHDQPTVPRGRALLVDAASVAAAYLLRFVPPPPWRFAGSEEPLGDGIADLIYEHSPTRRWIVDELKTGMSRGLDVSVHDQVRRLLAGGVERWRGDFLGVRLCTVASPRASRLFLPSRATSIALTDTWLWDCLA